MYIGILFPIMLLCFRYDFHDFRIDDKPYRFLSFGSFCLQHQLFQAPFRNVMHVLRVPIVLCASIFPHISQYYFFRRLTKRHNQVRLPRPPADSASFFS